MNNLDSSYQALLEDILHCGLEKKDRTGTGTLSVFGRQIRHKMSEGFPLLTTKKISFKTIVTELLWFLKGDTNIKYLLENDCHIWTGDAYKNYRETKKIKIHYIAGGDVANIKEFEELILQDNDFAKTFGDLGPIYGKQWRSWKGDTWVEGNTDGTDGFYLQSETIDQIQNLINELKTNPDSRRLMVSAWNVGELDQMVLPPCHYGFQVYTRELSEQERMDSYNKSNWNKDIFPSDVSGWNRLLDTYNIPTRAISLMFNMRSTDVGLGLGFNLASYGLLLMMIAKQVNMVTDELIYNGGDVHLYKNHIEPIKEQLNRTPFELPTVELLGEVDDIAHYELDDIVLKNYKSHPTIKMSLSN